MRIAVRRPEVARLMGGSDHHRALKGGLRLGGVTAAVLIVAIYVGWRQNLWVSEVGLFLLAYAAILWYPWRWVTWIAMVATVGYLVVQAHASFAAGHGQAAWLDLARGASLFIFLVFIPLMLQARTRIIHQLRSTQAQLTVEMERATHLAATQERARIARDLHDVLAHSLTVVSIQVQAARQIATTQPERVPVLLDEIGALVRESINESRRVVGVLREADAPVPGDPIPTARLRQVADRFIERTGLQVSWQQTGIPRSLSTERESALRFALQEALTNASRHGEATQVWVALEWEPQRVRLMVRDDGVGTSAADAAQANGAMAGGGNGLRGMRERAEALGGSVETRAGARGGFEVTMAVPLEVE